MIRGARGVAWGLLVVFASAAAYLVGLYSASGGTAPVVVQAGSATMPQSAPSSLQNPAPHSAEPALRRRISELEAKVRALNEAAGQCEPSPVRRATRLPPPLPFPPDLSPASSPGDFKVAVQAAVEKCAPGLRVQDTECSEYPCISWSTWDRDAMPDLAPARCDEWARVFGTKLIIVAKDSPNGDHFVGMYTLPNDPADSNTALLRASDRIGALAQSYGLIDK